MPSDLDLTTSQFDEDGFAIAIGFQPNEGSPADNHSNPVDTTEVASKDSEPIDADEVTGPQGAPSGYELVADMMRRQDEVLEQLDNLNARIELTIKQISAARKSEIEALESQEQSIDDNAPINGQQKAA